MKTTIAGVLVQNAVEYVARAHSARMESHAHEEVRFGIGAHLMIALALEGVGNEVGEALYDPWVWKRLEKYETPLKWYFLSTFDGRKAFDPGSEPLQTVQHLSTVRNRLAHPKMEDVGSEIIVRSKDGSLHRDVRGDDILEDGDFVMLGVGKLLDEFNAMSALQASLKGIRAIRTLRDHLNGTGFNWLDDYEKELLKILGSPPNG